jgi:hypothetical protein
MTVSRWCSPGDSGMIEIRWRISAALAGPSGMPATTAEPDVAEIKVPRIRTVVVFPAPLRVLVQPTHQLFGAAIQPFA